MADDRRGRGHQEESQYPPPPGEEDDRRPYPLPPPQMATGVTLPSIQDPYVPGPPGRFPPPLDPRSDPRSRGNYSTSPQSVNGYAAPPPPANSGNGWNLPPLGPPADQRASYGADGRDYYSQRHQYPPNPYPPNYDYRQQPPNHGYPGYHGDYRAQQQQQQQAAPRQRTSIACRYCRKRKIRCSGYQNTPDGKCTNCKKTGNDCVFQPVSSSTSTAFIPVSAVPGGVPPGTPLYGAFGQPLAPAAGSAGGPPQGAYPPSSDYALPSPTGSSGYYHHQDDRAPTGSRRPRAQDDEGMRLPPPSQYPDEDPRDPRRRSPVSMSSNTPPTSYHQYSRADDYDDRTPTPRRNSPGGSTMSGGSNVMALGNLVDAQPPRGSQANNIDQNMLGRLNRRS